MPIFILNWNGIADTIECMDSVLKLNYNNFMIILMDNGSDNNEGEILSHKYGSLTNVHFLQFEKNLGFCNAHIEAYHILRKEIEKCTYIALLNNDTVVDKSWLGELVNLADQSGAGMISSKMIQYHNREFMDNAGHWMLNTGEILPIGHNQPIEKFNTVRKNTGACGGGCLYRVSMIQDIGFFDPRFTTGYEDAEFGLRAIIGGYLCLYCPTGIVYHKMGNSITKVFNTNYSVMIHSSILYSYFKNIPALLIFITIPSFAIKYLAMFIINFVLGRRKYQTVMFQSISNTWKARYEIKRKREIIANNQQRRLTSWSTRKYLKFFLLFDIKRFWHLVVQRKKGSIDTYKNN